MGFCYRHVRCAGMLCAVYNDQTVARLPSPTFPKEVFVSLLYREGSSRDHLSRKTIDMYHEGMTYE